MEKLKSIGAMLLGIFIFLCILALPFFFLKGGVWLSAKLSPVLTVAAGIAHILCIFIFLPLSFFRRTRGFSTIGFLISSYAFGATLWTWSLITTYLLWGGFWVIIGVFFMGIGVVPMAFFATLFKGLWPAVGGILYLFVLTIGLRMFSMWLSEKD